MTEDSSSHRPTKRIHVYSETSRRADLEFVCIFGHDGEGEATGNTHALFREPFEADEFRTSSPDRHGWIRILPEGHPSLLRASCCFLY